MRSGRGRIAASARAQPLVARRRLLEVRRARCGRRLGRRPVERRAGEAAERHSPVSTAMPTVPGTAVRAHHRPQLEHVVDGRGGARAGDHLLERLDRRRAAGVAQRDPPGLPLGQVLAEVALERGQDTRTRRAPGRTRRPRRPAASAAGARAAARRPPPGHGRSRPPLRRNSSVSTLNSSDSRAFASSNQVTSVFSGTPRTSSRWSPSARSSVAADTACGLEHDDPLAARVELAGGELGAAGRRRHLGRDGQHEDPAVARPAPRTPSGTHRAPARRSAAGRPPAAAGGRTPRAASRRSPGSCGRPAAPTAAPPASSRAAPAASRRRTVESSTSAVFSAVSSTAPLGPGEQRVERLAAVAQLELHLGMRQPCAGQPRAGVEGVGVAAQQDDALGAVLREPAEHARRPPPRHRRPRRRRGRRPAPGARRHARRRRRRGVADGRGQLAVAQRGVAPAIASAVWPSGADGL